MIFIKLLMVHLYVEMNFIYASRRNAIIAIQIYESIAFLLVPKKLLIFRFHRFKENFNLPAVFIYCSHRARRPIELICQKNNIFSSFRIFYPNPSKTDRTLFLCIIAIHFNNKV